VLQSCLHMYETRLVSSDRNGRRWWAGTARMLVATDASFTTVTLEATVSVPLGTISRSPIMYAPHCNNCGCRMCHGICTPSCVVRVYNRIILIKIYKSYRTERPRDRVGRATLF